MPDYISPYILKSEYACKCCGKLPPMFEGDPGSVYTDLFDDFSIIRNEWGKPIPISSGYRCPKYNKLIGGSLLSVHMFGLALDMDLSTGGEVDSLDAIIEEVAPHLRRGKYVDTGTFIHIDCGYEIYPRVSNSWKQGVRWYG